ncbi:MAG: hypothetical protein QW319_04745 [Candidatus Nitrosocaldus sp.]
MANQYLEVAKELASIAPNWAKAIAVAKRIPECIEVDGQICRIAEYDNCIVGEAWGWKGDYKYADECKICENFAESFYSYAWEDHISNGVIDSLKEFIKHYRNKHAAKGKPGQLL